WTGSTWLTQSIESDISYTSLVLGADDAARLVYYARNTRQLIYARWTGLAWEKQSVDATGAAGQYASLALDSAGEPHTAYVEYQSNLLKVAERSAGVWHTQAIANVGPAGGYIHLALDALDR